MPLSAKQRAAKNTRLKRLYGITLEEFETLLAKQGFKCAICQQPFVRKDGTPKLINVDHDHRSGLTRGLLCYTCNKWLISRDDVGLLHSALIYLEMPPAVKEFGERIGTSPVLGRTRRKRTKKRK